MDIAALSAITALPGIPAAGSGGTRAALAQEFGRMLFHTMLQGATAPSTGGKGHKLLPALPTGMFADQFAQQLAAGHEQMFARMLFNGTDEGSAR